MADMLTSRVGQVNGAGDARAIFLMQFGGEVLNAFRRATRFSGRFKQRSISSGKSA